MSTDVKRATSEFTALTDVLTGIVEAPGEYANHIIADMWKAGYRFVPVDPKVDPFVWVPDPDRPGSGYLKLERVKKVREVLDEITDITGPYPEGCGEGLGVPPWTDPNMEWPEGRIVVYSVNGSSEGDWTHVEVHSGDTVHRLLLGKTFDGRDASWAFARRVADLLEA